MPKKIILVRHGETDFNKEQVLQGHTDTLLNKTGFDQAIAASKILAKEKIDIIYSSDLKRTYQTAYIISQVVKKEIKTTPLLRERYFGGFEGLKGEEVKKFYPHLSFSWTSGLNDSVSRYFKVEEDKSMEERVRKFLNHLKRRHKGEKVILVVHGGIIWTLLRLFNLEKEIEGFETTLFANASATVLTKTKNGYKIRAIR